MTPLCDQPVQRKSLKKIQIANLRSKECSGRKYFKIENLGHPQIMLTDKVKFELKGHFEGQRG